MIAVSLNDSSTGFVFIISSCHIVCKTPFDQIWIVRGFS